MQTNLPKSNSQDSAESTKLYFNTYGKDPVEFSANEVALAVSFFESKGFDNDAALTTASVLLDQAKAEGTPVGSILDTLKSFDQVSLSGVVAEILNNNRPVTSSLGYKDPNLNVSDQARNIAP